MSVLFYNSYHYFRKFDDDFASVQFSTFCLVLFVYRDDRDDRFRGFSVYHDLRNESNMFRLIEISNTVFCLMQKSPYFFNQSEQALRYHSNKY